MSAPSSQGSADSTSDSTGPDTATSSSANPTRTDGTCSEPAGPESPSTRMFMPYRTLMPDGTVDESFVEKEQTDALQGPSGNKTPLIVESPSTAMSVRLAQTGSNGIGYQEDEATAHTLDGTGGAAVLISSAEGSPARTSASPDDEPDSTELAADSSSSSPESSTLFDPAGYSSRTYPVSSLAKAVGTSESCLERWPTSGTAWPGGFSTHVSSECRSADGECSSSEPSLTEILEPPQNVPAKYSLSARAARGILRRAEKRGRTLPSHLSAALETVAQTTTTDSKDDSSREPSEPEPDTPTATAKP